MSHVSEFKRLTASILADLEALKANLTAIAADPEFGNIVAELNELDERRVTLLEPLVLQVRLQEALEVAADISLIDYVNRKDPLRKLKNEAGVSWFFPTQTSRRVTVDAIKAVRECLDHRLIDIRDGKRICELIAQGLIK